MTTTSQIGRRAFVQTGLAATAGAAVVPGLAHSGRTSAADAYDVGLHELWRRRVELVRTIRREDTDDEERLDRQLAELDAIDDSIVVHQGKTIEVAAAKCVIGVVINHEPGSPNDAYLDAKAVLSALESMRPHLSGLIGQHVAELLDNKDRQWRDFDWLLG